MKTLNAIQTTLLIATFSSSPLFGAGKDRWDRVQKLRPGTHIGIVVANARQMEGRFERASDTTLTLEGGTQFTVDKDKVLRIYKIGMSRKARTWIGGAIGLAAGAFLAASLSGQLNQEGFFAGPNGGGGTALVLAGTTGIGVAAANLTGKRNKTIYEKH